MQWRGRRRSENVEDVRGRRAAGTGAIGALVPLVTRRWGWKGLLVLAVVGVLAWQMGVLDPGGASVGGGAAFAEGGAPSVEEEELLGFVEVVLADTERVWSEQLRERGASYREPRLVVYRDRYPTGCGMGDARMGPFYCPADRSVYLDLSFYDELERSLGAPGDFAQAYVLAHEVGHHVQNLLGISDEVAARRGRPDGNEQSVRLELQADFLAGVWAHHNGQYLERGDVAEAMRAANRIGDDALQMRAEGRVVPHAFTHGTSEQRMRWFLRGLESGRLEDGDTFALPYDEL